MYVCTYFVPSRILNIVFRPCHSWPREAVIETTCRVSGAFRCLSRDASPKAYRVCMHNLQGASSEITISLGRCLCPSQRLEASSLCHHLIRHPDQKATAANGSARRHIHGATPSLTAPALTRWRAAHGIMIEPSQQPSSPRVASITISFLTTTRNSLNDVHQRPPCQAHDDAARTPSRRHDATSGLCHYQKLIDVSGMRRWATSDKIPENPLH